MAVRVELELRGTHGTVTSSAVLNGGFEIQGPHLLLPARCAVLLLGETRSGTKLAMEAAGGEVEMTLANETVVGAVRTSDRLGRDVRFRVLVSEHDEEVLVSDAGIDALGIRIESFVPGRWRFAEETAVRDAVAAQVWS